jgi:predicted nucleotidyltransferase
MQLALPLSQQQLKDIMSSHGVVRAYVFGSYARGEQRRDSDLDLLVEFEPERTLFDQIDLEQTLEATCGVKVDVVSVGGVRPRLKPFIERDAIELAL